MSTTNDSDHIFTPARCQAAVVRKTRVHGGGCRLALRSLMFYPNSMSIKAYMSVAEAVRDLEQR
jgi:predicted membrane-bound spermidine synthase